MLAHGTQMKASFDEAFERLSQAIFSEERRKRIAGQPYGVIFNGVVRYLDAGGELTHEQHRQMREELLPKAAKNLARDFQMQQQITLVRSRLGSGAT